MFPQTLPFPQVYPEDVLAYANDLAADLSSPYMWDHNILLGEMAYNLLAHEASQMPDEHFTRAPGFALPGDTYAATDFFSQATSPTSYTASPYTTNDLSPQFPSPSPSEPSPTTEYRQKVSKQSCCNATPAFCRVREKWYCNVCNTKFSRKSECRRHIQNSGRRAKCLACGSELFGRKDSLRRHLRDCKENTRSLELEDAFVDV